MYGWNDEYKVTQQYTNANQGTYQSGNFYGTYRIPLYTDSGKLRPPSGTNMLDVTNYMPTDGTYLCFYFNGGSSTTKPNYKWTVLIF